MSWKARLDHLIADGEHAAYLESREILEALLAQSVDERWRVILERDPRLERLVPPDYEWLLKTTATPKPSEVAEALAVQSVHWSEQWKQHSEQLTGMVESSMEQWNHQLEQHTQDLVETMELSQAHWSELLERRLDFRSPLRLLLLVFTLGVGIIAILHSNIITSPVVSGSTASLTRQNPEEWEKIVESLQSRWNELLEQRSLDLTKVMESSQTRWFEQWQQHTFFPAWTWLLVLLLIPGAIFSWVVLRAKATSLPKVEHNTKDLDIINIVTSSQAKWGERLERRSEKLLHAMESSQAKMETRLNQVLRETVARQEHQHEILLRVMAMEELGLKLIAGSDFHSELMALQAIWGKSELLFQLTPSAIHGVPGRPLLLVTLEHLYGDLLIQSEDKNATQQSFWNSWWPFSYKRVKTRNRTEKMEERIARALREIRRGDWNAGIEELLGIDYLPIAHWTQTARTRLALEEWYSQLRQEVWGRHLATEIRKKSTISFNCFKTCRFPFCKPNKLCIKQLLQHFKKVD